MYYKLKIKHAGMSASNLKRMKLIKEENKPLNSWEFTYVIIGITFESREILSCFKLL